MTDKEIEKAAEIATCKEYGCSTCAWHEDCHNADGENTPFDCCECPADSFKEGYFAGAKDCLSHQWVSVEDRLPDSDTMCLVSGREDLDYSGRPCRYTNFAWYDGQNFYDAQTDKPYHPLWWMPIPQLDTEKEER